MGFELQPRDQNVMRMIYDHGGILHSTHIQEVYWPEAKGNDALRKRLNDTLTPAGYINHNKRIKIFGDQGNPKKQTGEIKEDDLRPEAKGFYWLGWRGAIWIAQDKGHNISMPETCSKEQQERLMKQLGKLGITWRPEPLAKRIRHDANINNVHVAISKAAKTAGHLTTSEWTHEDFFRLTPQLNTHYPDAFFYITDAQNHPGHKARYLLELDRTNHDLGKLLAKFRDGLQFLRGEMYREVSKATDGQPNAGRYLIVLESKERLQNLLPKVREAFGVDAYVFLLATFADVTKSDPLLSPIWQPGDGGQAQSMLDERYKKF